MILIKEVLQIHDLLIAGFGGSSGVRDLVALESSLSRPFQTFDGKELYPAPANKAAAILESLLINHPFVDGNKRTAYVVAIGFLMSKGITIKATEEEKYILVIKVASGESSYDEIVSWLLSHFEN
jgi:death-on-curing protein